jgi:hypothetical protein
MQAVFPKLEMAAPRAIAALRGGFTGEAPWSYPKGLQLLPCLAFLTALRSPPLVLPAKLRVH